MNSPKVVNYKTYAITTCKLWESLKLLLLEILFIT